MRSRCGSYQSRTRSELGRPAGLAGLQIAAASRRKPASRRRARGGAGSAASAAIGSGVLAMRVEDALRGRRADARQQLQHAEAGDAVARVLGEAQHRQHVLDMGGSRNFSPPNLTKGMLRRVSSISSGAAVVRGAEQHRLLLQRACRPRGSPASRRRRSAPGRPRRAR